ncbi:DUF2971 domain-containing protein [Formosa sediminum]|uniref:DUF2971 domain-containing protein n=1 Tax=Formosa sediminum TaxID=2594004 RepID=A0A516GRW4_9FLAO|nr:DUF2971 domain-containing protein [Formosa sediminum]QDO94110.1 DUF2971 domain-containing protein [Formosa sediminum]
MFYKFRDFSNYKYLLDIFINQRIYASSFRNLNDNFEGQFYTDCFLKPQRVRLNPKKNQHISICSFSGHYENHLLWSHYSDGHRGLVIAFELDENKYEIQKVNYSGLKNYHHLPHKFVDIKSVFLNKIKDWEYEDEYRIILKEQCYIDIIINEVIFGSEVSELDKNLISKLIEKIDSKIKIKIYNED